MYRFKKHNNFVKIGQSLYKLNIKTVWEILKLKLRSKKLTFCNAIVNLTTECLFFGRRETDMYIKCI